MVRQWAVRRPPFGRRSGAVGEGPSTVVRTTYIEVKAAHDAASRLLFKAGGPTRSPSPASFGQKKKY